MSGRVSGVPAPQEDSADEHAGRRWGVYASYSQLVPVEGEPGRVTTQGATPDEFIVRDVFAAESDEHRFATEEEADSFADELNRLEVQGPIPPEFVDRRERLKKLAPYFRHWAYTYEEGPPGARWPVNPDRYLVLDSGVGFHPESWEHLFADKAAVEEYLRDEESNVYRIVDLDTGEDVPFTREIVVTVDIEGA